MKIKVFDYNDKLLEEESFDLLKSNNLSPVEAYVEGWMLNDVFFEVQFDNSTEIEKFEFDIDYILGQLSVSMEAVIGKALDYDIC